MGPQTELLETIITCTGNYYSPDFTSQFNKFKFRLQKLVVPDNDKDFLVEKIEPWNSIRVTLKLPLEAANKLKHLAEQQNYMLREMGVLAVQIGKQQISLDHLNLPRPPQRVPFTSSMSMLPNVPPNCLASPLASSLPSIITPMLSSKATSLKSSTIKNSTFSLTMQNFSSVQPSSSLSSSSLSAPSSSLSASSSSTSSYLLNPSLPFSLAESSSKIQKSFSSPSSSFSSSSSPQCTFARNYSDLQLIHSISSLDTKLTNDSPITTLNHQKTFISPSPSKFQTFSSNHFPSKSTVSNANTISSLENAPSIFNQNFASSSPLLVNLLRSPGSRNHNAASTQGQDFIESCLDSPAQLKRKRSQPKKSKRLKLPSDTTLHTTSIKGDLNYMHSLHLERLHERPELQGAITGVEQDKLERHTNKAANEAPPPSYFASASLERVCTPSLRHTPSHTSTSEHHQHPPARPILSDDQFKTDKPSPPPPISNHNNLSLNNTLQATLTKLSTTISATTPFVTTPSLTNCQQHFMRSPRYHNSPHDSSQTFNNFTNTHSSEPKNNHCSVDQSKYVNNIINTSNTNNYNTTSFINNSNNCHLDETHYNNNTTNNNNNNTNNNHTSLHTNTHCSNKADTPSLYASNGQLASFTTTNDDLKAVTGILQSAREGAWEANTAKHLGHSVTPSTLRHAATTPAFHHASQNPTSQHCTATYYMQQNHNDRTSSIVASLQDACSTSHSQHTITHNDLDNKCTDNNIGNNNAIYNNSKSNTKSNSNPSPEEPKTSALQDLNLAPDLSENQLKFAKRGLKSHEESHISFKSKTNLTVAQLLEQVEIAKNSIPSGTFPSFPSHKSDDDAAFGRFADSCKSYSRSLTPQLPPQLMKARNTPNHDAKLEPLPMAITSPGYPHNLTESVQKAMRVVELEHSPLHSPAASNHHHIASYLKNNQWPLKLKPEWEDGVKVYSEEDLHDMMQQRGSDHNTAISTNSNNSTLSAVEADMNFCLNADDENHLDRMIASKDYEDIEKLAEALASNINDGNLDDMLMSEDFFSDEQLHQSTFKNNAKNSNNQLMSQHQSSASKHPEDSMQSDFDEKAYVEESSSSREADERQVNPYKNGDHVSESERERVKDSDTEESVKKMRRRGGKKEPADKPGVEALNEATRMSTRSSKKSKSLPSLSTSTTVQTTSTSEVTITVSASDFDKNSTPTTSGCTPRRSTRTIKKTEIALESSATKASERQRKLLREQTARESGQEQSKNKSVNTPLSHKPDAKSAKTRCVNNKKVFNKLLTNCEDGDHGRKASVEKLDCSVSETSSDPLSSSEISMSSKKQKL